MTKKSIDSETFIECVKIFKSFLLERIEKRRKSLIKKPKINVTDILKDRECTNEDTVECKICLKNVKWILLECGHMFCASCVDKMETCPLCRKEIMYFKKTFV